MPIDEERDKVPIKKESDKSDLDHQRAKILEIAN